MQLPGEFSPFILLNGRGGLPLPTPLKTLFLCVSSLSMSPTKQSFFNALPKVQIPLDVRGFLRGFFHPIFSFDEKVFFSWFKELNHTKPFLVCVSPSLYKNCLLRFTSDGSSSGTGFLVTWATVPGVPGCGGLLTQVVPGSFISSQLFLHLFFNKVNFSKGLEEKI